MFGSIPPYYFLANHFRQKQVSELCVADNIRMYFAVLYATQTFLVYIFPLPSSFAKLAHPLSSFISEPTYFRENNQPPQKALSFLGGRKKESKRAAVFILGGEGKMMQARLSPKKRIFADVLKPDIFHLICGENFGRQRNESLEGLWNERGVRIRKKFSVPHPASSHRQPYLHGGLFLGEGRKEKGHSPSEFQNTAAQNAPPP